MRAHQLTEKLDRMQTTVDEAARHVQKVYLTFLLFCFYVAVIVISTTDEQLLRVSDVTLPILNIGLPIIGFYIVVPYFVVLLHLNLLLQFYLLSRKLYALDQNIEKLLLSNQKAERRTQLYPFLFNHMLIGKHYSPLVRLLLRLMIWVSVVLFPMILLFLTQLKFVRYHSHLITCSHRFVIVLDLVLVWTFCFMILQQGRGVRSWWEECRRHFIKAFLALLGSFLILWFCFFIVVVPGGIIEGKLAESVGFPLNLNLEEKVLFQMALPPELVAAYHMRGEEDNQVFLDHAKGLNLKDRNLKSANFIDARLLEADLRGAKLQGADLRRADLQGADLRGAKLQGAVLWQADLQGAVLWEADLQGAVLWEAKLQGADLWQADLQGAVLRGAKLQGAVLREAKLQGAVLWQADLQGAVLRGAKLQGADLRGADLQGAVLREAKLQGADLRGADLQGADLRGANLQGAVLWQADLQGAVLEKAFIGGTLLSNANLKLTNLDKVSCELLSTEDWQKLQEYVTKAISEGPIRDEAINLLKAAEKRKETLFDPPDQIQKSGAFYDNTDACFAGWPPTLHDDKEVYYTKRVKYLSNLACEDKYIAEGLARQAIRLGRVKLAEALLEKTKECPEIKQIHKETLNDLKKLVQEAKKDERWSKTGWPMLQIQPSRPN